MLTPGGTARGSSRGDPGGGGEGGGGEGGGSAAAAAAASGQLDQPGLWVEPWGWSFARSESSCCSSTWLGSGSGLG